MAVQLSHPTSKFVHDWWVATKLVRQHRYQDGLQKFREFGKWLSKLKSSFRETSGDSVEAVHGITAGMRLTHTVCMQLLMLARLGQCGGLGELWRRIGGREGVFDQAVLEMDPSDTAAVLAHLRECPRRRKQIVREGF